MILNHSIETGLIILALILGVVFVVLHIILASGSQIWWILAFATILIAISDLIMKLRHHG